MIIHALDRPEISKKIVKTFGLFAFSDNLVNITIKRLICFTTLLNPNKKLSHSHNLSDQLFLSYEISKMWNGITYL